MDDDLIAGGDIQFYPSQREGYFNLMPAFKPDDGIDQNEDCSIDVNEDCTLDDSKKQSCFSNNTMIEDEDLKEMNNMTILRERKQGRHTLKDINTDLCIDHQITQDEDTSFVI